MATSESTPSTTAAYSQLKLDASITCSNLIEDGGAPNSVKPSWSSSGNVQFILVKVGLINQTIPVKLNGEFQILYSVFHNITATGTDAILELNPSGIGDDTDATAEIPISVGTKESTTVKRVYKSIFKDLNININGSCLFQDCIFNACSIKKAKGVVFKNCLFYLSRTNSIEDNSNVVFEKCYVCYQAAGSFIEAFGNIKCSMTNSLARPNKIAGAQSVPFIKSGRSAEVTITNLTVPANSEQISPELEMMRQLLLHLTKDLLILIIYL